MAGCNCGKRRAIIGAAVKAVQTRQTIKPLVREFGRTIRTDLNSARVAAANAMRQSIRRG